MANSNFYDGYGNDPYTLDSNTTDTTTSDTSEVIEQEYTQEVRMTLNNWPLCAEDPECNSSDGKSIGDLNPTEPQEHMSDCNLNTRSYGVTFESIRQNIASYNFQTIVHTIKHIVRTYFLEDGKTITQEVDMREFGIVITKLSGDTGFDQTLIKTEVFTPLKQYDTVYGVE